ncbi:MULTISPECIES: alpha/beta fold hydrolase [Variovorax]|uniref:alpha/beta fold hydrolase n=1 Tax=Variovorax TaxID=34072 RepID=UPI0028575EF8|nr:alpha/beta hydrolase [Variovorax sp. 3319]MDR6889626.1 proline iminopeptidase [Variovorax sp. 3319]
MTISRRNFNAAGSIFSVLTLAGCGGGGSGEGGNAVWPIAPSPAPKAETSGFASVNGKNLYHVSSGKGVPIVFMHGGLGLDHQYFRPFIDPLADHARIVCYDQLGQGKSDRPASYDELTLERMSADCNALTKALGIDKFVLVGHSFGGFVALDFALRFPDRLSGLVLSCTAADTASFVQRNPVGGTPDQQAALGQLLAAPVASDEDLRKKWTAGAPLYYNNATPPAGVIADVDQRTTYSGAAFNRGNQLLADYNFVSRLSSINVPTSVNYGSGDIWRFGDDEKLAKNIPGAALKYFANSGHWPFQEEPAEFIRYMRSFIAGLPA